MNKLQLEVMIVDDEPISRKFIHTLLKNDPDIKNIRECAHAKIALNSIRENPPDILFLDIRMPELDGFQLLEAFGTDSKISVVFVTAYDEYAIQAFDVNAVDYLLKPFDRLRLQKALERAKTQVFRERSLPLKEISDFLQSLRQKRSFDRILINKEGSVFFLQTEEIDWVEAKAKYVYLHCGKETYLVKEGINKISQTLNPKKFVRIHKSATVHIDRIQKLKALFRGDYKVILVDGTELNLSRGYRKQLFEMLGRPVLGSRIHSQLTD